MPETKPVVFINGLWIHSLAWGEWIKLFREQGYDPYSPGWPGESETVATTRERPDLMAGYGIEDITQRYADVISGLPTAPIVIGHSFGGLVAQKLLARGLASAAVALDPGLIKGVKPVSFAQVRSGLPVLSRPGNKKRSVSLSQKQFRYSFGNAISESESNALFERWTIPGPGRPLFEATSANFSRKSPAEVDTAGDRGPLLFVAGGKDHTVPAVVVKAAHGLYRKSPAVTDIEVFDDRGHSLVFDSGWKPVADPVLTWLATNAN